MRRSTDNITCSPRQSLRLAVLEDGPEVFQLVEQVPNVVARALDAVRVQIGEPGVVAVTVERFLGLPLDDYQHAPRRE